MKTFFLIAFLILASFAANAQALQEVAGKINVDIKPGETKSVVWGIISDENKTLSLDIKSYGNGSQFLSYPKTFAVAPNQVQNILVNVTIPSDYNGPPTLSPYLSATQAGQKGGSTVINLQVIKMVTINIQSSNVPEFGPIVPAILVIAIISVIVLSRKARFVP